MQFTYLSSFTYLTSSIEHIEIMAYCKFPPPSALYFDLSGAKFMHSHINRMYIKNSMSFCVSVGTGKLPNPKYQQYYDAENDYLVPYNSGDTGEKNENESASNSSNSVEEVDDYYCQMEPNEETEEDEDSSNGSNKSLNTQPSEKSTRSHDEVNDDSSDCVIVDTIEDSEKVVSDKK